MKKIFSLILALMMLITMPALVCNAALVSDGTNYYQYGDVNTDGEVNILDLIRLKKITINITVEYNMSTADINSDGNINSADLIGLRKMLLMDDFYETDSNWTTEY